MLFDLQPTLIGRLIRLRPVSKNDFHALYAAGCNPAIWVQHPQNNRYQRLTFEKFFESALESKGALVVIDLKTDRIIGSSRFYELNVGERVTIGFTFLETEYWGGACNRELKHLMLNHAFRFVSKVVFEIGENNLRSIRAIEKIGARRADEGTIKGTNASAKVIYLIQKGDAVWEPGCEISSDKTQLDLNLIHRFLSSTYWAKDRSKEIISRSINGSHCVGAYYNGAQVGFARAVTDGVLFGYIFDVFVLESHRRQRIGKALVASILERPGFEKIRWMLRTDSAGSLYECFGFRKLLSVEGLYVRALTPILPNDELFDRK